MTMFQFSQAFFISLLAGLSTIIGALVIFFIKVENLRILGYALGFSAGAMIYISFVEILPKTLFDFLRLYSYLGVFYAFLCFLSGIAFSTFLSHLLSKKPTQSQVTQKTSLQRIGILSAIIIGIHNFPEGFATFSASVGNLSFGILIALVISLHNIPEGMIISLPLYHATGNRKKAIFIATLSGIAEPIGAVIGAIIIFPLLGESSIHASLAFASGVMIYIALKELLPQARKYGDSKDGFFGLVFGALMMAGSVLSLKSFGI